MNPNQSVTYLNEHFRDRIYYSHPTHNPQKNDMWSGLCSQTVEENFLKLSRSLGECLKNVQCFTNEIFFFMRVSNK